MTADVRDVLIVGGGPAGLSAALWLGRYRRSVIVCDSDQPRNEPAWAVHGYPGLPDPSPLELRRRLVKQALGDGAQRHDAEVVRLRGEKDAFVATTNSGDEIRARRVILAYGLRDYLPAIEGLDTLYGTSVFHCPDCDGPAVADTRIGVIGANRHAVNMAIYMRHFSDSITLLAHDHELDVGLEERQALAACGIDIEPRRIARVIGHGGNLTQVDFDDGEPVRLDAIFFHLGSEPRCDLAQQLGCRTDEDGYIATDRGQETSCAGVHAAGDITGHPHLASIAAAEGVRAALAIHRSLLPDRRV